MSQKKKPSGASEIPILFTIGGSRHELFIISTASSYSDITSEIATLAASSPNCTESLSKYKKAGEEKVTEIKVKWAATARDAKIWPTSTILTEDNTEAVLMMIEKSGGLGRDVFEVRLEGQKGE
ncbi:hypothetical protein EJ08DRAFT_607130 [Tothia fuscella]|uniref:Uncharacterized protein n=1 Tax=Tothia fuscella TaxID=1048955 RepID=A0A9P4NXI7_9PEZI|nr:hypothetical protein EJ08DRAFT_607130 [Tothia fuscella]